jgi:putative heme-binding domain-containing protein
MKEIVKNLGLCALSAIMCSMMHSCSPSTETSLAPVENTPVIAVPDGFQLEELYSPSVSHQGSWVSLTEGPNQTMYACDQYGKIYHFPIPAVGEKVDSLTVIPIDLNMGYAQGLLYAFNSLYVVVVKSENKNQPQDPSSGVYRLTDSNNDGELDNIESILKLDGDGEHGPHTLRVSPDGQAIYLIAGNFNHVPAQMKSKLPRTWQEDNLFPPYLDARGHANDLTAPGGWIATADPDGRQWTLVGAGMRNPFSFGFNRYGDLFAYDADMEWDFGMPWYRPTRILHVTSGAEFGWRTGSGKWPAYLPDNLPSVVDMAQGSPTAVIMGKDLKFPTKYRDGLFACDWSFGTVYFVDIKEKGSSYTATKTEFLSGVPLPISNAIAGSDGNLYFTTGGRRLSSHLYRLRYVGNASTERPTDENPTALNLRAVREEIETFHKPAAKAVEVAWPYLSHEDRHIRYAARIAVEHQALITWAEKLWTEKNSMSNIEGIIAYARTGGRWNKRITQKLAQLDVKSMSTSNQIDALRAYELMLIRQGVPGRDDVQAIIKKLSPMFPADDTRVNRLLSQILVYLNAPDAVSRSVAMLQKESKRTPADQTEILNPTTLSRSEQYGPQIADMLANMPPTESIHYATLLSHATEGWTKTLRETYFKWFNEALSRKGGESYKAFIDNIRAQAMNNVPAAEKAYFQDIAGFYSPTQEMANLPQPKGPGKDYTLMDLGSLVMWSDDKFKKYKGDIADGKRAYEAALCSSCHRMKGEGASSGPDLTNIGTRFTKGEIANAIFSPSEEISDQYAFTLFKLKDGTQISGRMLKDDALTYTIYQSPYNPSATTTIDKANVSSSALSGLSPMPAKLLSSLSEEEVVDLFVYLLSGADENHEYYKNR